MGALSNSEIGSVVYNMVENIPVGISGIMTTIVNQQIYFAEQYTGDSISESAVDEKYQPAIISLTASNVLSLMESQGIGTKSVKIGELSITKGMQEGTSVSLRNDGMQKLDIHGKKINFYQTFS